MSVKNTSYINFNGDAREAMAFYQSIFGGTVDQTEFGDYAEHMPVAPGDEHKIMHAYLHGDTNIELMGADVPTGMEFNESMRGGIALSGEESDETQLREYWQKLSSDARQVFMNLEPSPWGATFGSLLDKYGVHWMINIGG